MGKNSSLCWDLTWQPLSQEKKKKKKKKKSPKYPIAKNLIHGTDHFWKSVAWAAVLLNTEMGLSGIVDVWLFFTFQCKFQSILEAYKISDNDPPSALSVLWLSLLNTGCHVTGYHVMVILSWQFQ